MGKVSLTCGDIFYRQTSFRMTLVTCSFTVSKKSRLFSRCPYLQKRWAAVDGSTFEIFRQLFLIKYCLLMLIQRGKQCY